MSILFSIQQSERQQNNNNYGSITMARRPTACTVSGTDLLKIEKEEEIYTSRWFIVTKINQIIHTNYVTVAITIDKLLVGYNII